MVAAVSTGSTIHPTSDIIFKFEPFVLHVSCRSLSDGQRLLRVALAAGFKNSGMIVGRRITVAVRATLRLEVPVVFGGKSAVSDAYVMQLVRLSNEKLADNFGRIDRFFEELRGALDSSGDGSSGSCGSGGGGGGGGKGAGSVPVECQREVGAVLGERLHRRCREWLIQWADNGDDKAATSSSSSPRPGRGGRKGGAAPASAPAAAAGDHGASGTGVSGTGGSGTVKGDGSKTWEPLSALVSPDGCPPAKLVAFEQKRTGLLNGLQVWSVPAAEPGTVTNEPEGFRVYHCREADTVMAVAAELSVPSQQLLEQNATRYGLKSFKMAAALAAGMQLRLPQPAPPLPRSETHTGTNSDGGGGGGDE
jgi:hypothetical protein